jgi:hypothetical protein
MRTKQDFVTVIDQVADRYPQVAALRRAGDPRYFQHQEAMATMFAMLSQQIEIGMMEPFEKARDATVLADAALKGIIPKASSARVKLLVKNTNTQASFQVSAGRRLLDTKGHVYEVDRPVLVPAASSDTRPGEAFVEAVQRTVKKIKHTVTTTQSFYAIEVPPSEDGRMLAVIDVEDALGRAFTYTPNYTNIMDGERVYHVEMDAYQRLFVKFGISGVIGYQPTDGEEITLVITESAGDVRPDAGSPFSLEYAYTPADGMVEITFSDLLLAGSNPMDMTDLRELCRYPSTYDDSAVFLGEFDRVVRKKITNLQFLSIWNEQIEEQARGPNINNINALFVSFEPPAGADRAATYEEIKKTILRADNGLKVRLVETHVNPIEVTVTAKIARIHDPVAVNDQIKTVLLDAFGMGKSATKSGMFVLQNQRVAELLKERIFALSDVNADFTVRVQSASPALRPEQWSFVSPSSMTINIEAADYNIGGWGR